MYGRASKLNRSLQPNQDKENTSSRFSLLTLRKRKHPQKAEEPKAKSPTKVGSPDPYDFNVAAEDEIVQSSKRSTPAGLKKHDLTKAKPNQDPIDDCGTELFVESPPKRARIDDSSTIVDSNVPKVPVKKPRIRNPPSSAILRKALPRLAKEGPKLYKDSQDMYTYDQQYNNYQSNDTSNRVNRTANNHSTDNYHNSDGQRQQLQDIATSMASLCNIGNSCYMNSVIYTLRFAPLFLHKLHHLIDDIGQINSRRENTTKLKSSSLGRNVSGLQGQNARSWSSKDLVSLGNGNGASSSSSTSSNVSTTGSPVEIPETNQHIAIGKLHELYQNLHRNETSETLEPYQSDELLKAIQDVNPIFEGNQQQDAHEFLLCILDSLRETNQSLTKVIFEHPEIINNG